LSAAGSRKWILDYKKDFPEHLERTIAAMANTFGGIILLGVEEDAETKPILPLAGVAFDRGLRERVINIILDNVTPPIFPDIAVCPNPTGTRAAIMIRIQQSHQAPHAVRANTGVYLRTDNRNKRESRATLHEIEWLQDHRRKSDELRTQLLARAAARAQVFRERRLGAMQATERAVAERQSWLNVACCPMFPKEPFVSPPDLIQLRQRIVTPDYVRRGDLFPPADSQPQIVQDGIVLHKVEDAWSIYHTEVNIFGLFFFQQSLLRQPTGYPSDPIKQPAILAGEVFCQIDQCLAWADAFYRQLDYLGPVLFEVQLTNIAKNEFVPFRMDLSRGTRLLISPDPDARFSEVALAADIGEDRDNLVLRAGQKVAWTFGSNLTATALETCFREHNRPKHQPR